MYVLTGMDHSSFWDVGKHEDEVAEKFAIWHNKLITAFS